MLARMRRHGNPFTRLEGMETGAATLKNSMEVPQKIENRTTLQPRNCTIRYLSKEYKNADSKGYTHPCVYSRTIEHSQSMERVQMSQMSSTDEWIKKRWYIYTMEYYLAIRKNEILPFCNKMDGTRVYYAEQN